MTLHNLVCLCDMLYDILPTNATIILDPDIDLIMVLAVEL